MVLSNTVKVNLIQGEKLPIDIVIFQLQMVQFFCITKFNPVSEKGLLLTIINENPLVLAKNILFSQMFTVSTTIGLVACLLANVIIPTIDVMSDLNLALRMWQGSPGKTIKRYKKIYKHE